MVSCNPAAVRGSVARSDVVADAVSMRAGDVG